MSNILDTIVAHKKKEVARMKEILPVRLLEARALFLHHCYSLEDRLKSPGKTGVIAEFKRKSPSEDVINDTASVSHVTHRYTKYGASGLSILTDTHFFGGTNADLETARAINKIPILRKDFVVDEYQIFEAKSIGADVILLIAECLSAKKIEQFTRLAKTLQMEVLLEMHSEKQLDKISPENTMIGINNRDLTTFKVDIDRSIKLAEKLPKRALKIAESGINDPKVVIKMKKAGFDGFLMGSHFMKEEEPGEAFRTFVAKIRI